MRTVFLACLLLLPAVSRGDKESPTPEAVKKWGGASIVVLANLTDATYRGAGLSDPPVHLSLLSLTVGDTLRGTLKKGEALKAAHSIRQKNAPMFPVGKDCLVALSRSRGAWTVVAIEEAQPAEVVAARKALSLPLGWTLDGKKLRSPWAALEKKPEESVSWKAPKGMPVCGFTGRPAFLVGPVASFKVEKVKPKVDKEFANPDGDGEYTITVGNPTDKPITVPALLTDGKRILWKECLVVLCQGKTYSIPGAVGIKTEARPVLLKPGETVSTVVNALSLKGPSWPMGGARIEFEFALGERSEIMSFYYLSKHHDPIREKAAGK